jgi:hypothetical protein
VGHHDRHGGGGRRGREPVLLHLSADRIRKAHAHVDEQVVAQLGNTVSVCRSTTSIRSRRIVPRRKSAPHFKKRALTTFRKELAG